MLERGLVPGFVARSEAMNDGSIGVPARPACGGPSARRVAVALLAAAVFAWVASPAGAIMVIGPTDPGSGLPVGGQNTSAPAGSLANSGWQFEGAWQGSFTGV